MPIEIAQYIREIAILAVPLLLALTVHEVAHGWVAFRLGDPTAKLAGRLTLNPLKHLDPIGTIVFFIASIGWAKPVPVNARYFKDPQRGMLLVAAAGPGANFVLAVLFAWLFHLLGGMESPTPGSLAERVVIPLYLISQAGVYVNIILGIFNLIPVPPLDGSNIVAGVLPRPLAARYLSWGRWGVFAILGLILVGRFTGFSPIAELILGPAAALCRLLGVPL